MTMAERWPEILGHDLRPDSRYSCKAPHLSRVDQFRSSLDLEAAERIGRRGVDARRQMACRSAVGALQRLLGDLIFTESDTRHFSFSIVNRKFCLSSLSWVMC